MRCSRSPVASSRSSTVVPSPGRGVTCSRPPASSARSRIPTRPMPSVAARWPRSRAPSSATRTTGRPWSRPSSTRTLRRAGVVGDVRQPLLRDAVDDESARRRRGRSSRGRSSAASPGSPVCVAEVARPACAARAPGRGRRARSGAARAPGAAAPPSPGRRDGLGLAQLGAQLGRRVVRRRPRRRSRTRGQRLVDLVVQVVRDARALALLAAQHGAPRSAARSSSRRASMRLKPARRRLDVLGVGRRARRRAGRARRGRRAPCVDQLLQRREAAAQHDALTSTVAEDAPRRARAPGAADDVVERQARGDDRRATPVATISSALTARTWVSERAACACWGLDPISAAAHRIRYSWCSKSPAGTFEQSRCGMWRGDRLSGAGGRSGRTVTVRVASSASGRAILSEVRIPTAVQVNTAR